MNYYLNLYCIIIFDKIYNFKILYKGDSILVSSDNTNLKFLKAFSELLKMRRFEQIKVSDLAKKLNLVEELSIIITIQKKTSLGSLF